MPRKAALSQLPRPARRTPVPTTRAARRAPTTARGRLEGKARLAERPGPPRRAAPPAHRTTDAREQVRFSQREREYAFSVAMKYVKDEDEAADVTQDALLLAYRHRASFRGDSRFTTWLYRVAATAALMHLRKKRRMPRELVAREDEGLERDDGESVAQVKAPGPSPEDALAAHEAVARARARLDEMGDKYGDVFLMRFRDGYSESEIARKLNLNVTTVKTRAYRARAAIRADLEGALRLSAAE